METISTCEALSAISALSAGLLVSHADSFYCPTERTEKTEILLPARCEAISDISDISSTSEAAKPMTVGLLLSHADSFYCPAEMKEIKEILLPARCEALSAISALSSTSEAAKPMTAGHYYLMRIVFILSRRHEGNKGNSSFGCCLRSAFGLKTSGSGTSES